MTLMKTLMLERMRAFEDLIMDLVFGSGSDEDNFSFVEYLAD